MPLNIGAGIAWFERPGSINGVGGIGIMLAGFIGFHMGLNEKGSSPGRGIGGPKGINGCIMA